MNSPPALSTVITTVPGTSWPTDDLGFSTSMPRWTISRAVTMKITSSTSATSTNGVTLMSVMTAPSSSW